jgi:hypothetical protein
MINEEVKAKLQLRRYLRKALPLAATYYPSFVDSLQKQIERLNPERHSEDFSTVKWYGWLFKFNPSQAVVVGLLWKSRENGTPYLRCRYLIEAAGVNYDRFDHLFRISKTAYHDAWKRMIHTTDGFAYIERRTRKPTGESTETPTPSITPRKGK